MGEGGDGGEVRGGNGGEGGDGSEVRGGNGSKVK